MSEPSTTAIDQKMCPHCFCQMTTAGMMICCKCGEKMDARNYGREPE